MLPEAYYLGYMLLVLRNVLKPSHVRFARACILKNVLFVKWLVRVFIVICKSTPSGNPELRWTCTIDTYENENWDNTLLFK